MFEPQNFVESGIVVNTAVLLAPAQYAVYMFAPTILVSLLRVHMSDRVSSTMSYHQHAEWHVKQ